jgi:uncharacterized protein YjaG (DUF416 family)
MFPNYIRFQHEFRWGDYRSIRSALDIGWNWLEDMNIGHAQLAELRNACARSAPETEDFDTILASAALDAASAACLLLDQIPNAVPEKAVEVSTLARDTVDMYVQVLDNMPANSLGLEERIRLHPLMQKEIERQYFDLDLLSNAWTVNKIAELWRSPQKSNMGI